MIAEGKGMAERSAEQQQKAMSQTDDYIRSVASQSDSTEQIAKAKQLLDSGAITATEYDALKAKALRRVATERLGLEPRGEGPTPRVSGQRDRPHEQPADENR